MTTDDIISMFSSPTLHEGASLETIHRLQELVSKPLPAGYMELMCRSNGIEGFWGGANYLMLFPAEQLSELNKGYLFTELVPHLWLFGSDGGSVGYAFDTRYDPMPVKKVWFLDLSDEEAETVGSDFESFLQGFRPD
jgi:hypothetical protein